MIIQRYVVVDTEATGNTYPYSMEETAAIETSDTIPDLVERLQTLIKAGEFDAPPTNPDVTSDWDYKLPVQFQG